MYMKAEINTLCKDLMISHESGFVNAPIVLMVYLGKETYDVVNASLKDAFTSSFRVEPDVHDIQITDNRMDAMQILNQFVDEIRVIADQGRSYDDIKITFVTLMDDPIFEEDCSELSHIIREALEQLSVYGIGIRQTSFYGIFRQSAGVKKNYQHAFAFVNSGKNIWKSIYHMEVSIFDSNISKYTQLLAANNMSDDYTMVQNPDSEEYAWKSIYVHCLKVPELIIAKLLQTIYDGQINGKNVNVDAWERNVDSELNAVFERLFQKQEYNCEQYIPLNYQEVIRQEPTSNSWLFKRRNTVQQTVADAEIIKDRNSIDQLLDVLYGSIQLDEQEYEQIMERIISAASSVDNNSINIAQSIRTFLDKMICDYQRQLENEKTEMIFNKADGSHAGIYIHETYAKQRNYLIIEKKIEIIQNLIQQLSNGNYLNRMIQNICGKSKEYTDCLNELIRNEYGGVLQKEQFDMTSFPSFKVNQSPKEIIKAIGNTTLSQITNDAKIIYDSLEQFLHFTLSTTSMNKGHMLGQINGEYNQLEPIIPVLLVTPKKCHEMQMQIVLNGFSNLQVRTDELYRDNSFYVITSRLFASDRYISRYKRV